MNSLYETIENSKQNEVVDCPNHRDKICILRRLQRIKDSSSLIKSLKSETDDGLSSCSNFPERPTLDEMQTDKPVLPEIEHLRGKLKDEQLEAILGFATGSWRNPGSSSAGAPSSVISRLGLLPRRLGQV